MVRLLLVVLAVFGLAVHASTQTPEPISTSLCEIAAAPEKFDNRVLRLRATIISGFEVFALADPRDDCGRIWLVYPGDGPSAYTNISGTTVATERIPVSLKSDRHSRKLGRLLPAEMYPRERSHSCMDCPRYRVTALLEGRLDVASRLGFGHLNGYRTQFVVSRVREVQAVDLASSYGPEYSTVPIRFPTAYVRGKVRDENGKPIEGIPVSTLPDDAEEPYIIYAETDWTEEDGSFKISVPPGKYVVGVNLYSPPSDRFPYLATFFPVTNSKDAAHVFALSDRQKVRADFRLQSTLQRRFVPVQVLWPNGDPVKDANVWLAEVRDPDQVVGGAVSHTDRSGSHRLVAFEGIDYILFADIYVKPFYTPHCATPQRVNASDRLGDAIVMVLDRTRDQCQGLARQVWR